MQLLVYLVPLLGTEWFLRIFLPITVLLTASLRLGGIHSARSVGRLQGAAIVAVRKHRHIEIMADGHKGRTLHTPEQRDDYFISWW